MTKNSNEKREWERKLDESWKQKRKRVREIMKRKKRGKVEIERIFLIFPMNNFSGDLMKTFQYFLGSPQKFSISFKNSTLPVPYTLKFNPHKPGEFQINSYSRFFYLKQQQIWKQICIQIILRNDLIATLVVVGLTWLVQFLFNTHLKYFNSNIAKKKNGKWKWNVKKIAHKQNGENK